MTAKHRVPTSPGEILDEEFLCPLGLTQTAFARHVGGVLDECAIEL